MNEITPEMKTKLTRALSLLSNTVVDYIFDRKEADSQVMEATILLMEVINSLDPR